MGLCEWGPPRRGIVYIHVCPIRSTCRELFVIMYGIQANKDHAHNVGSALNRRWPDVITDFHMYVHRPTVKNRVL